MEVVGGSGGGTRTDSGQGGHVMKGEGHMIRMGGHVMKGGDHMIRTEGHVTLRDVHVIGTGDLVVGGHRVSHVTLRDVHVIGTGDLVVGGHRVNLTGTVYCVIIAVQSSIVVTPWGRPTVAVL